MTTRGLDDGGFRSASKLSRSSSVPAGRIPPSQLLTDDKSFVSASSRRQLRV